METKSQSIVEYPGYFAPFADMKYEQNRLNSFTRGHWGESRGNPHELAKAGFYFRENKLQCYVCNMDLESWNREDVPMDFHKERNPHCNFVKGTADNVPIRTAADNPRIPESARNGHVGVDQVRQGPTEPIQNGLSVGRQPVQNGFGVVPEHLRNGHHPQQNEVEPMDEGRTEVEGASANSNSTSSSSGSSTGSSGSSSSTESRRPPQQYTGLARVEILRKLKREVVRFRTYQNWSSTAIQPNLLAKAGFFYFNDRDKVQCAFCLGIIGQWEPTDDPFVEHRRHFPRCPFVLGLPVGNVPIDTVTGRERSIQPQINGGFDVTGIRPEVRVNAEPERGMAAHVHLNPGSRWDELGIEPLSSPAMPAFLTVDSRFKTFQTWPRGLPQKPMELAEAGLYYTGVSDEVKCFHCDGGLRGWEPNDNPWVEHAKWFPHCKHVILLKGKDFVEESVKKNTLSTNVAARRARAEQLMSMEPYISALNMGLDHGDVKKAILNQLEKYGRGFRDLNSLVSAAYALAQARAHEESVNGAPAIEEQSEDSGFGSMSMSSSSAGRTNSPEIEGQESTSSEVSVSQESGVFEGATAAVPAPPAPVPAPTAAANVVPVAAAEARENGDRDENMDLLCKICMEKKVSIVILPCAHLCSCADCASSLRNCPICRKPFKGYVRAFLS